ncbi:MAG: hypothetical protein IJW25_03280 [Clostridia bacterium]|nr:hypothetical protein [Clostridia bacterium]
MRLIHERQSKIEPEVFKTQYEFNKKFPSRFFSCSNCQSLTDDAYYCKTCGWRADGLFKTMGEGYIYTIAETGITTEIFKPIEILEERGK